MYSYKNRRNEDTEIPDSDDAEYFEVETKNRDEGY